MPPDVQMPVDWDDHAGWEAYYSALPSDQYSFESVSTSPGSFSFERLGSLIDDLQERNWTTVWFPGCGYSPLPRVFASFGFTVYATDIASSSVAFQDQNESIVQPLLDKIEAHVDKGKLGRLVSEVHDAREDFGEHKVDIIFNIRSFQGFCESSMAAVSQTHFKALGPGGLGYFDTMNVQGESRDQIEDALVSAGFYIPVYELNKWYRNALAETGIPYALVLGNPIIPQNPDVYPYSYKSPEYERDRGILRGLTSAFRSKAQAEYDREQELINDKTKYAEVIYSTG